MQITEVKNDILKMAYSPYQNGLLLSDFLLVSEGEKSILAQVIGLESSSTEANTNIATLKCCLSVDETGKIGNYLGFTPSTAAEIATVTQEQVISMLVDNGNEICLGYLAQHDNVLFKTEKEFLSNKPVILIDDHDNYNVIVNNIAYINKKSEEKTVIVDFDGSIKVENAFYVKIGDDFKLPLSHSTLNYIYENELKDENLTTQAVVQDIIIELQEYIKTLSEKFLPFSTVKDVIFAQYQENKIPELMLLKNKFVKYAGQGIFAETRDDFSGLNDAVVENNIVVIDVSEIDSSWHKLVLSFVTKEILTKCYFVTRISDETADKKNLHEIYSNKALTPILATNYDSKNAATLKAVAKNMILFPPIGTVKDFPTYSAFMQKLNRDEYVVCGENTLYLTFILKLTYLDSNMAPDYIEREIQKDVDTLYSQGSSSKIIQQPEADIFTEEKENKEEESVLQYSEADEVYNTPVEPVQDEELTDDDLDFLDELDNLDTTDNFVEIEQEQAETTKTENTQETYVEGVSAVAYNENDSIIEEMPSETQIQEYQPSEPELLLSSEQPESEFLPEADTSLVDEYRPEQIVSEPKYEEIQPSYENHETMEPANVISGMSEIVPPVKEETQELQQELPQESAKLPYNERPIPESEPIPVYSVPELEVDTPADFKEGNFVFHEKYGRGVIEKIMHYGNKTLCSIQFEEVGRRLLDPNLAGLQQV